MLGNSKYKWYTLAYSDKMTYKMRFREEMEAEEAIELAKQHCKENNLIYAGIHSEHSIDFHEEELQKSLL